MRVVPGEKAASEMDSRFRGNDEEAVRGACARLDRGNDELLAHPSAQPLSSFPRKRESMAGKDGSLVRAGIG